MSQSEFPSVSLDEIRSLLSALPGPDLDAGTAARTRQAQIDKVHGPSGKLGDLAVWMSVWQAKHPPVLRRPRVAVFAANHGFAAHREMTLQRVKASVNGDSPINQICEVADADLRVYELDLDAPTADFTQGPAMSDEACARAIAYGMMAVEQGIDLICLGDMGAGSTLSAAALCLALFGGEARDWAGGDGGAIIEAALTANPSAKTDPFEALRCLGGFEIAAIAGAVLAARMGHVPVVLDGFVSMAAAAVIAKAYPPALDHCLVAHRSNEPGHARLLEELERKPLFDFGMGMGMASGAALAIPVLKSAIGCHNQVMISGEAEKKLAS